jgi:hypothetical protein
MNTVQLSQRFSAIEKQIAEIRDALLKGGLLELPPESPRPAELPTVEAKVTTRFRASVQHTFTVIGSFECPSCSAKHEAVQFFIGDNGGSVITGCEKCKANLRVKLAWDVNLK